MLLILGSVHHFLYFVFPNLGSLHLWGGCAKDYWGCMRSSKLDLHMYKISTQLLDYQKPLCGWSPLNNAVTHGATLVIAWTSACLFYRISVHEKISWNTLYKQLTDVISVETAQITDTLTIYNENSKKMLFWLKHHSVHSCSSWAK